MVVVLSYLVGWIWGWIGYSMIREVASDGEWAGLAAAPLIGVAVGLMSRDWHRFPPMKRAWLALVSLHAAVALFGMVVAIGAMIMGEPSWERTAGMLGPLQYALGVLVFMWLLGYVLFLWPLSIVTHHVIWYWTKPGRPYRAEPISILHSR